MKTMLRLGVLLVVFSIPYTSKAYILHKQFTMANYGTYNCEIYIPDGTTGNLPTVIFIPGMGESNTDVNGLYVHGPLYYIRNQNWRPNFIVVGVQPLFGGPAPYTFLDNALDSLFANPEYHVNQSKWYLTGLSYGAAAIFSYIYSTSNAEFRKPAAIVPMSYKHTFQCGDYNNNTDYPCGTDLRWQSMPAWGLCGSSDAMHYTLMNHYFQKIIQNGFPARFTTYASGHCCWNTYYNPSWTESINGTPMSIYQWMLQYPLTTLPVSWGAFNYNAALSQLQWSTETETDNDHFEIEESDDGVTWHSIGTVPTKAAGGNSTTTLTYTFGLN